MSAYICDIDHIKQLAIFAVLRRNGSMNVDPRYLDGGKPISHDAHRDEIASKYADILYQENIRSVRDRYPDDRWDDLPGPIVKPIRCIVSETEINRRKSLPAVQILKMCDCLEYQSCETADYRTTAAYSLLNAIRRSAIRTLPGYEEAEWEYSAA